MKPEVDVEKLCKAAYRSNLSLARCRENVNYMVRQYVGDTYADEGASHRVPLNLIGLYHRVVLPKLASDNPRIALSTWTEAMRRPVETMQDVANEASERMRLGKTLEMVASSALFSSGWCKVGVAKGEDVGRFAWRLEKGHVYCEPIALDDICFDINARTIDTAAWVGHRFRVPLHRIKEDKRFKRSRVDKLVPTPDKMYTETGVEKSAQILRGYYGTDYDLWDMVELWEFYIPESNTIVVLSADDVMDSASAGEPLVEEDWIGPKGGSPFHLLGFGPVPENLLPKAPIPDLFTLHEDVNNILRKQIMQARDQKKVLPIRPGSEGDGKRLINTSNGEAFECANPEGLKELNLGGPDQANFQMMMALKEMWDWLAGNVSSIGGLAPQAKTLGQERLISESSNATVADMQRRMVDFSAAVCKHVLWYLWEDPFTAYEQPLVIPGLDLVIPREVTAAERKKIPFEKLKMTIEPYSLQRQTPVEIDQQLMQLITELGPLLPVLMQGGQTLNVQELLQIKAKLLNRPELLRIFSVQAPPEDTTQPSAERTMPTATKRTYERTSRSERTPQGEAHGRVEQMMATAQGGGGE